MMKKFFGSLILFLSIYSFSFSSILEVTSPNDSGAGSLREQISNATSGDTIQFSISGIIALDSQIFIQKNIILDGPGADQLAIDGQEKERIFFVNPGDTLTLRRLSFIRGNAGTYLAPNAPTGGVAFVQGHIYAYQCIFRDNKAVDGGAFALDGFNMGDTYLYLENCALYNNSATESTTALSNNGGAILADARMGGEARVEGLNTTITGNRAIKTGGAIFLIGDPGGGAGFRCTNCTISKNNANNCGGVDHSQAEISFVKNSIIADNGGEIGKRDFFGAITSLGNNIIGENGGQVLNSESSDFILVDPEVGPFGFNGGTIPVLTLKCNSPAIDAGDDAEAPTLDSRGESRIGTSDIGAYERNEALDLIVNNTNDDGGGSLRQAVSLSCNGDTIDLQNIQGIIALRTPLLIEQKVKIEGNRNQPLRLDGGDSIRVMEVLPSGNLDLSWVTISGGNPSQFGGGGIRNQGTLSLRNSTITQCTAASGGAIATYGTDGIAFTYIANSTLSGNNAQFLDGGAIDNRSISDSAITSLVNCTLADNAAFNRGGGISNVDGRVNIHNTILSSNTAFEGQDGFGAFSSLGTNIIQDTTFMSGFPKIGDQVAVDPLLGDLVNFVGPSPVYLLQDNSPAIDAGNNNALSDPLDQTGRARILNNQIDIGALEYEPLLSNDEPGPQLQISIYPQPARDYLHLEIMKNTRETFQISIRNLQGMEVWNQTLTPDSIRLLVRTSQWAPGFYMIQIKNTNFLINKKILISR